jgi:Asp/Glu/hydantoin racemase
MQPRQQHVCPASVRAVSPIASQFLAFLVAYYSDHSFIKAFRDELLQLVVGIMEASLFGGRTLDGRFSIVAASQRTQYTLQDSV